MHKWEDSVLQNNVSIREVIENLNRTSAQIVLIVNSDSDFVGLVVDGDIRRGILRGITVNDEVGKIVNRKPKTISPGISRSEALALMNDLKIAHLPIVDDLGRLCGLESSMDLSAKSSRENLFVIMAGGFGKRMGPITKQIPKPMLNVKGKPIMEHLILGARNFGFTKFAVSIHHKGEIIEEYFEDGSQLGVEIRYLREPFPLGTAGSLALLDPFPEGPVIVSNADLVLDADFGALLDFHITSNNDATMGVRNYELQNPFGVVTINDGFIDGIVEKPLINSTISAGVYVLEPSLISSLPKGESIDMPAVFQQAIKMSLKVMAFPIYENWTDIGQSSDLTNLNSQSNV